MLVWGLSHHATSCSSAGLDPKIAKPAVSKDVQISSPDMTAFFLDVCLRTNPNQQHAQT